MKRSAGRALDKPRGGSTTAPGGIPGTSLRAKGGKVVFSVTAAQLYVLRAVAAGETKEANAYRHARRDPAYALLEKGLVEPCYASHGRRWQCTPLGQAVATWVK